MKVPRRINDLVKAKQAFIDSQRTKLTASVAKLQEQLLTAILAEIIPRLETDPSGLILDTEANYRLISELDAIYRKYGMLTKGKVLKEVNSTFTAISDKDYDFLTITLGGDLPEKFREVAEATRKMTEFRFGVSGGRFVRGGFLEALMGEMNPLALKRHLAKLITSQVNTKDFIKALTYFFQGAEGFAKKFERFAFDVYQQYDATYNSRLAQKLELKNFIYQGGLIEDSRDFCAAHDAKVWTVEEAEKWDTWTPAQGKRENQFPEGWVIKQKDPYKVPSYLGYAGYDPLIDRGGYNCRHQLTFISDELARRLRPRKEGKE